MRGRVCDSTLYEMMTSHDGEIAHNGAACRTKSSPCQKSLLLEMAAQPASFAFLMAIATHADSGSCLIPWIVEAIKQQLQLIIMLENRPFSSSKKCVKPLLLLRPRILESSKSSTAALNLFYNGDHEWFQPLLAIQARRSVGTAVSFRGCKGWRRNAAWSLQTGDAISSQRDSVHL